ncbi:hypothetical protein A8B78_02045 [Jannaschia sp. EhC01]|nr:hypothetical protein A8B78_02045 [Jannaschia sp. EhC01]
MTNAPPVSAGAATVPDAVARAAWLSPGLEAIVAPDGRITFGELADRSTELAQAFAAMGVAPGDRVALCMGNSVKWVTVFLALARIGAVTVPVNTRLKADEIGFILRDAGVALAVVSGQVLSSDIAAMLPAIRKAAPNVQRVIMDGQATPDTIAWIDFVNGATANDALPMPAGADDLLIQYTSGTTAFPKAVPLSHLQMLTNGFVSGQRLGLRACDRLHSARPFFHVAGTTLSILSCLQHQSTLISMVRFNAAEALSQLAAERCTHFAGNGTMASMLLDHADLNTKSLHLRGAWLAASPAVVTRVMSEMGAREAVTGYGLSEASPNVAQSAWWEDADLRASGLMTPQPGVEVRIGGKPLDEVGEGEITVRGWSVMREYLGRPDETAKTLSPDGWLSTGDLGRSDGAGRFAFIGRLKEMLRVGGENVSPAEVEALLLHHPAISFAEVVAVPDARLGDVPVAFCVSDADPETLVAWAKANMAGFKAPRHIWCIPDAAALGLNASGKVSKAALTQRAVALLEEAKL